MFFDRLGVSGKLLLQVALLAIALLALSGLALQSLRDTMLREKQLMVRNIVETAIAIAKTNHERAGKGEVSMEAAQKETITALRAMRYAGSEYVFAITMQGIAVAHGGRPALEGTDMTNNATSTPNSRNVIGEMRDKARAGGGYVAYTFAKPGTPPDSEPAPKIAYTAAFTPWNWFIGTGIYVDDVDTQFRAKAVEFGIITLVMALVLIGLSLLILRSVRGPLRALSIIIQRLADGETVSEVAYTNRPDEIGGIARATAALREVSLLAARTQSGLENATTNVMVADTENRIVYCNRAVLALLRNAASDIRKDLPRFDPDALIGRNIDEFHKNPAHQRGMLAKLSGTHRSRITVGGRIFELIVNPAVNTRGARVGTVVEWSDMTDQLRLEREVIAAIAMASEKGFAERVDLEGKNGFLRQLGEAVNGLSDKAQGMTRNIAGTIEAMARGDLSRRIAEDYPGIFGELRDGANETVDKLREVVGQITATSNAVRDASAEISAGSADLAARTEAQAASLEETAAAMHQVTATVKQNADNAQAANQLSQTARDTAAKGGSVTKEAVAAVRRIEESARKISDIVALIDEIAFQTNLLALNASVEAARAGEAGKGFAVVAQEVRALAQRSANASKDIKALINESNAQVKAGASLVHQAGESLDEIVGAIKKVSDIVAEIAAASSEQSRGLDEVNAAVGNMDEMTQRNGALVEQTSASAQQLATQGQTLAQVVGFFRT